MLFQVQKSFANKLFSNKNVAKGLIDNTSAALLDELYKLVKLYVSESLVLSSRLFERPFYMFVMLM